jgi:hypothetical protein
MIDFYIPILATGAEFAIIALLAAGTATAAVGQYQQGKAAEAQSESEQDILNYNARLKEEEAEDMREAARREADKFAEEGRRLMGTQKVRLARGNVLSAEGAPALLLEETALELDLERLDILKSGFKRAGYAESEAAGLRFEGKSARARGKNLKRGATLAAGGTLLSGMGQAGYAYKTM